MLYSAIKFSVKKWKKYADIHVPVIHSQTLGKIINKIFMFYYISNFKGIFLWRIFDLELRWNICTILIKEDLHIKKKA